VHKKYRPFKERILREIARDWCHLVGEYGYDAVMAQVNSFMETYAFYSAVYEVEPDLETDEDVEKWVRHIAECSEFRALKRKREEEIHRFVWESLGINHLA